MSRPSNLKTDLLAMVQRIGEPVEAIVVGKDEAYYFDDEAHPDTKADENRLIDLDRALELLDKDYDSGYGGADCRPFYAWTKNHVIMVSEYDGSTGMVAYPRHPIDIEPSFS